MVNNNNFESQLTEFVLSVCAAVFSHFGKISSRVEKPLSHLCIQFRRLFQGSGEVAVRLV